MKSSSPRKPFKEWFFRVAIVLILVSILSTGTVRAKTISPQSIEAASETFDKYYPANGDTQQPADTRIEWVSNTGAIYYEYCIDSINNNICDTSWVNTGEDTFADPPGLLENMTYYWHIRAFDGSDTTYSNGNTWWSFTTGQLSRTLRKESNSRYHFAAPIENPTWGLPEVTALASNLVNDPGFEFYTPNPFWSEYDSIFGTPLCDYEDCGYWTDAHPYNGYNWAWFGGISAPYHTASVAQTVTFPNGGATLQFYFWIGYAQPGSDANDAFFAKVDGVTVFSANATQIGSYGTYKLISVDVSSFANGAAHTIQFSHVTTQQAVSFNLDDVSLIAYNISGNAGVASATVKYSIKGKAKTVTADGSGNYTIAVPSGWSGTVTPSKNGYVFSPASRTYSNVVTDRVAQSYTASPAILTPWVGGATITSDKSLVAVGRPHVGAEVATYGGFSSGSTIAYVPMLFKDAFGGSYDSALYIENLDTTNTATITIRFYDASGNQTHSVPDTIAPLASKGYWLPSISALGLSWVGGVKIESDRNIVAVGRPHIGSQVMTYNGFPAGSANAYVPMLFKDAFGGSYDSALYVQNVDPSNTANITIRFYDASGNQTYSMTDTISPLASKGYWLPSISNLGPSWVGGVKVESDQDIVAVGRPHIGSEVTTYGGFSAGSLTAYVPMLFKDAFGGSYDSALYVENLDPGNIANITIRFYDNSGVQTYSMSDTISPLASKGYWLPSISALGSSWVGGVKIESDQDIVAVGRPHIGSQVMTYNGFPAGSANAYVPMLFKDAFGGSYNAAFYLQNTENTTATVTVNFYDSNGNLSCTRSDNIPALSTLGYWVPTVTCEP